MGIVIIVGILLAAGAGAAAGFYLPSASRSANIFSDDKKLDEAKEEANQIHAESKEKIEHMKKVFADEERSMQESFERMEEALKQKEDILKRQEDRTRSYENNVKILKEEVEKLDEKRKKTIENIISQLAKNSGMTNDKALTQSRENLKKLITENKEKRQNAELEEFQEDIMRHATAILQLVIQRLGVQSSVDKNSTSVVVQNDKFKGMLIGKNGKNIAYLEELLPISVIFNLGDTKTIHVGGVNLLRRNIGKRAIEKLQKLTRKSDKLDHAMIKQAVEESEKEIMEECDRKGEWGLKQLEIDPKKVNPEVVNYIGRLYFRTSYGQNILYHSLEMAQAARLIAELIGADVHIATEATFFHDLGKAIDHDIGGSHDDISKELLEKYGYDEKIVHAAYAHHDKVSCESPEDFIVKAADAISGGRPGSRQESVVNYFERIKQLEEIARSFDGINKVLTMSAGREMRLIVNKDQIKDEQMSGIADSVAEKISEEVSFPGMIKVNLIRTTKAVDYARDKTKNNG